METGEQTWVLRRHFAEECRPVTTGNKSISRLSTSLFRESQERKSVSRSLDFSRAFFPRCRQRYVQADKRDNFVLFYIIIIFPYKMHLLA